MARLKNFVRSVREPAQGGRYIGLEHVESGTGHLAASVDQAEPASAIRFRHGDVLFGKLRPYLRKVLRPAFDGRCTSEMLVLRPCADLDPTFLAYLMLSDPITAWCAANSDGAKMPRTEWASLGKVEVDVPDLVRQRSIADYLNRETARLDTLMERMDRSAWLVRESLLARVEHKAGRSTREFAPLRRFMAGITTGSRDWSELVLDGDSYLIRATNLRRDSTLADLRPEKLARLQAPTNAEARRAMLQPGDVLVCVTGYPGSVAYWTGEVAPAFVSQHVAAIRPAAGIVGHWLAFALFAPSVQAEIAARQYGGTKQGLGLVDLKELRVPLIGAAEQTAVASDLATAERIVQSVVRGRERQIGLLREKRQALITAAVTGQISIPGAA